MPTERKDAQGVQGVQGYFIRRNKKTHFFPSMHLILYVAKVVREKLSGREKKKE